MLILGWELHHHKLLHKCSVARRQSACGTAEVLFWQQPSALPACFSSSSSQYLQDSLWSLGEVSWQDSNNMVSEPFGSSFNTVHPLLEDVNDRHPGNH